MRAFDAACNVPWAIRPEALRQILAIAAREFDADLETAAKRLAARFEEIDHAAVSVSPGTPLQGARTIRMRGSTAVLPIEGPLFRYANLFSSMSGASSVEELAHDLHAAQHNPDVTAILLHVDSPGGEVNGIAEFAELVHRAAADKNVIAYVSNEGASAAYWIASAARRIVVAPTALVGSIGVVAALPSPEAHPDRVEFVSSQSPKKRPDIGTKGGRAQVQTIVDDLADQFVGAVARYRGCSVEKVLADFGQGDVMVGAKSVTAGLADEVSTFEDVLGSLVESAAEKSPAHPSSRPKTSAAAVGTRPSVDGRDSTSRADSGVAAFTEATPESAEDTPEALEPGDDHSIASESSPNSGGAASVEAASTTGDVDMTGWRDRLLAAVREIPDDAATTPPPPAEPARPAAAAAAVSTTPDELVELRAQLRARDDELARQRAANQRLFAERITERAEAFAAQIITVDKKAFPSQQEHIVAQYVQCATDDAAFPLEGTSRVALLAKTYAAAPKHLLDEETIPQALHMMHSMTQVAQPGAAATDNGKDMTEERRARLLGMTAAGRDLLAERRRN